MKYAFCVFCHGVSPSLCTQFILKLVKSPHDTGFATSSFSNEILALVQASKLGICLSLGVIVKSRPTRITSIQVKNHPVIVYLLLKYWRPITSTASYRAIPYATTIDTRSHMLFGTNLLV